MYIYEKIHYDDIVSNCRKTEIEMMISDAEPKIKKFSDDRGINADDVKKQIRLHAPQFNTHMFASLSFFDSYMLPVLEKLFDEKYIESYCSYIRKSGADYLLQCEGALIKIKDGLSYIVPCKKQESNDYKKISYSYDEYGSDWLSLEIKPVCREIGTFIENQLHYLRSERNDSIMRIGLFRKNYQYPICYMSYCIVDRLDKKIALAKSIGDDSFLYQDMIELSRVYGCGKLPYNAISFLNGRAIMTQELQRYNVFITAVNPVLGFNGNSVRGAGFVPYATRQVQYNYNENGLYCTNRKKQMSANLSCGLTEMPNNILYVKSRDTYLTNTHFYLVDITNNYTPTMSSMECRIYAIRNELEKVWDERTRYHGVKVDVGEEQIVSKGQCGVSSLLLAEIISNEYHYNALFCEGDAHFPFERIKNVNKENVSIINHCWIEIDNYNNRMKTVIIDITADQNGYGQKVIFDYKEDLNKRGVIYKTRLRSEPQDVNVEHLRKRLDLLSETMKEQDLL